MAAFNKAHYRDFGSQKKLIKNTLELCTVMCMYRLRAETQAAGAQ